MQDERLLLTIMNDITDRKRAEEALRASRDELQAIYDGMLDGILIVDRETLRFVRANASICRMLDYSEAELLALSVWDIHPADTVPPILAQIRSAQDGSPFSNREIPFRRKDGSIFYAEAIGNHIVYNRRLCSMGIFRDVTERRRAKEALERQHRTLTHLLRSSDHERQLIAYEIHDGLAQHLAGAIMQLDSYVHQRTADPEFAAKALEAGMKMLRQGHIESRRLISGVRPPILDESGVVAALAHLVNDERHRRGPKIEYICDVTFKRLTPILENAVYRIIQEGLSNACRHSKSKQVRVELIQHGDWLQVGIQDQRIGFTFEGIEDGHYGLAGIRERARLLGGEASIESQPGVGTRIIVELPVVLATDEDE